MNSFTSHKQMFSYLVDLYNKGRALLILKFQNIEYDKNFHYDPNKDILTANSSQSPNDEFGSDGQILAEYIEEGYISIEVHFKKTS